MNPFTGVVLYILIWWTALFAVLPFGTKPVADADGASGWRGAPEAPRMWRKVLVTTVVASVIWVMCYVVITSGWVSFRTGPLALPVD